MGIKAMCGPAPVTGDARGKTATPGSSEPPCLSGVLIVIIARGYSVLPGPAAKDKKRRWERFQKPPKTSQDH